VHNVVSLATVPVIFARGAAFYADYGAGRSRGTLPIQLAGNLRTPGLVEKAFGVSLRELIEDFGGGTASGRPVKAVQRSRALSPWRCRVVASRPKWWRARTSRFSSPIASVVVPACKPARARH